MKHHRVIWTPTIWEKLKNFRSEHFTSTETYNYINQLIIDTENLLKNPIVGKTYTEEDGRFKGISRIVIKQFRIYYKRIDDDIVIIGLLYPKENK
jgi:hypothetical protein